MKKILYIILLSTLLFTCRTYQSKNIYSWEQLPVGSKSYVTEIIAHPTEADLIYIRTWSGKVFRWNAEDSTWIRVSHHLASQPNKTMDVESFALAPHSPEKLYISCTLYDQDLFCRYHFEDFNIHQIDSLQSCILVSLDYGQNWQFCGYLGKSNSRENRMAGSRIAIDPLNENIIYYLADNALFRSDKAGKPDTWNKVNSFSEVCSFEGTPSFIIFNQSRQSTAAQTDTLYIGIKKLGIYRSIDAGTTWHHMRMATRVETRYYSYPINPMRAIISSSGDLYITHATSLSKWDETQWLPVPHIPIETQKESYCAIDIAENNDNNYICATFGDQTCNIYFSKDSANSWTQIAFKKTNTIPFMPENYWGEAVSSAIIDPTHPNKAWFTDKYGVWYTDSLYANISKWSICKRGQEEICVLSGISTSISPLLVGMTDINGVRYENLHEYPGRHFSNPNFTETTSLDFCEADPNYMARVGSWRFGNGPGSGAISVNNGKNWIPFIRMPFNAKHGRIAYSAQTPGHFVWLPFEDIPYVTRDNGKTWKPTKGAPLNAINDFWSPTDPIASDRVNGNIFYFYHDGSFYRSDDGAETWKQTASLPSESVTCVKATPGHEQEVWVCLQDEGLFVTHDGGDSFEKVQQVKSAQFISFGISPTEENSTIFVYGTIGKHMGLFRSDNGGKKWLYIKTEQLNIDGEVISLIADRQSFGKIYIGTAGSGCYMGQMQ